MAYLDGWGDPTTMQRHICWANSPKSMVDYGESSTSRTSSMDSRQPQNLARPDTIATAAFILTADARIHDERELLQSPDVHAVTSLSRQQQ